MSRRNPLAKWVLPEVVDPVQRICVTLEIPDDRHHRAAFLGALLDLGSAYKWQDDAAHTAKDVALVWRDVYDKMKFCELPPEPIFSNGIIEDFAMPIRVDCDCRVWVTCCDGTEVELATVGMIDRPTQPGDGSETPTPGGCVTYHARIDGPGLWFSPAVVNTGDTIEVTLPSGATYDPVSAIWRCPDGNIFFAGACVPGLTTDAGNPMPAVPQGKLIARIGATHYDVIPGLFAVPASISDEPLTFLFNYATPEGSAGQVTFDVNICNNAAVQWQHDINLKISTAGFEQTDGGLWTPSVGWQSQQVNGVPNNGQQLRAVLDFGQAVSLNQLGLVFDTIAGTHGGTTYQQIGYRDIGGGYHQLDIINGPTTGTGQTLSYSGAVTAYGVEIIGVIDVRANPGATDGLWTIYTMPIGGVGYDPFV